MPANERNLRASAKGVPRAAPDAVMTNSVGSRANGTTLPAPAEPGRLDASPPLNT
ncbi:MAG TPA: hypothetical protein VLC06_25075 [Polyangia bacterium]|nr:hypothetical protein [Polyangia bacterium]